MSKKPKTVDEPEKNFHVPLAETLQWIEKGEKQRDAWGSRSGKIAELMTDSLDKHLRKLRKQAEKLQELFAEEQNARRAEKVKKTK